jgi:hypothetical protein
MSQARQGLQLEKRALHGRHEAELDALCLRAEAIRGEEELPQLPVRIPTRCRAVDDAEVARLALELADIVELA